MLFQAMAKGRVNKWLVNYCSFVASDLSHSPELPLMKKLAVVIPSYNEEDFIEACVKSLLQSNFPQEELEILVCDGRSEDRTADIVSRIAAKHTNVRLLLNEQRTTPFALNIGLKASEADVKIILGAHSEVHEDFLANNLKALDEFPSAGCVGGVIDNVYADDLSKAIGAAMSSKFGVGNALFRTGAKKQFVDTVAFGAYRKEVFEKVGYFDTDLTRNQDDEFNFRVTHAGFKVLLDPAIKCKYYVRGSFQKLYKQYYQYGYWKVFVNKKHKSFLSIRQLVPPLFVSYLLTLPLCFFVLPEYFWFYSLGLAVYLIVALTSALGEAGSLKHKGRVFASFVILHFSYGWGYLLGIKDFILLNRNASSKSESTSR